MERLFIVIVILCATGYTAGLFRSAALEYEKKDNVYVTQSFPENKRTKIASGAHDTVSSVNGDTSHIAVPGPYHRIIYSKSHKYNVEPSLVSALIKVESNWDSSAVSDHGAIGLMQLMPSTARDMMVNNPFDPEQNIEGGIKYLRYLLDRFNGNITFALAAYNAGPKRIEKYKGIPPFKETKQYVKRILSIYNGGKVTL